MIEKIVSGGQTGVDRAALDVAITLDIPHGGWCPKGRLAELGTTIPKKYCLKETESNDFSDDTSLINAKSINYDTDESHSNDHNTFANQFDTDLTQDNRNKNNNFSAHEPTQHTNFTFNFASNLTTMRIRIVNDNFDGKTIQTIFADENQKHIECSEIYKKQMQKKCLSLCERFFCWIFLVLNLEQKILILSLH